jgi:hypothetical protein
MEPQDAIAECRQWHGACRQGHGAYEWARWPAPLISFLAESRGASNAFVWVCSCVGELLDHFGKAADELKEGVSLARRQAIEDGDIEAIQRAAWKLWLRRTAEGPAYTAVAQLLFVLLRDPSQPGWAVACYTPICLLERLESRPGEVLDRVVADFSRHVAR